MTPSAWIALAAFVMTFIFNGIALAIGYGVMKGTLAAIAARVTALEQEMGAITDLRVAVGKIEAGQTAMLKELGDLATSVRWMREPVAPLVYTNPKPRAPRTKRPVK